MIERIVVAPFVLALIISAAITSITIRIYKYLGLVDKSTNKDHPKNIHTHPVPRGGGVPIFLSMLFVNLLLVPVDAKMIGIFAGAGILLILGVLDDIYNLSPYLRLILGTAAAAIVVIAGIGISFVSNPAGVIFILPAFIGNLLAIMWVVWTMNFVNMGAKGLDGQLPGVVVVAAVVMGILSLRFLNDATVWPSTAVAFSLAGAYAGLLIFNMYPQKIMPGWGGGSLAGYFLAVLSMLSGAKVATAMIVLGILLMDVLYAILRRLLAGKSPVWGDNKHLHHLLLRMGWSKRQVTAFYVAVTAILGLLALQLDSRAKAYAIVMLAVLFGGFVLWIKLFLSQKQRE